MSLPRSSYDPRRVCLISLPRITLGPKKREFGVYASGALFAIGWWFFLDACVQSSHSHPPPDAPYDSVPVHVRFEDWLPGLLATLGMIIVNLIDKQRLDSDDEGGMLGGVAWKARLFLFIGFAMMAAGLAGSIAFLVIKYIIPDYSAEYGFTTYWGIANVVQNVCIMLSASILWVAQNADSEYEYNLAL
ncbi:uncharacterized protein L969DRAFT_42600 [Mixia osmundae IAM 14324]|uniref:Uncharacterized protein n=1 Tax=Mixia osmundae (strain CBS 9802 / IAM 14324 / JCM 22182 / KY 12970) TaxID=764103 RepID=G7E3Y9_MIXOS|nr:uncharacterized protein L969DRAFT_42600 [Mixia osmundae IAM 14324]KEI41996.1 hypothetical protein L969DRAFT_42600 [Mixia osmundae IAM 14324]GAA97549.1 hypothetical protein E5Q_04227 [Mixia osmundae IAM 14324]